MNLGARLLGVATAAGLAASLSLPAAAQSTTPPSTNPNVPANMTVPNSGTHVQCNPNGTATVTQEPNATVPTTENVPGTPVTQNNPNGPGTTTTQTPALQKPTNGVTPQCPKTTTTTPPTTTTMPSTTTTTTEPMSTGPEMNALTNNPNGSNWLDKFNRPGVAQQNTKLYTRRHHAKRASGGGGGGY